MTESSAPILRPMTLGELLDRAIRLYRQNFFKFIGIFAIPYIPLALIQAVVSIFSTTSIMQTTNSSASPEALLYSPGMIAATAGGFLVLFVQFIFVQGVATAALTRAVANNYTGKPVDIIDSYRTLSTSWLKLVLALILVFILVVILSIWMIIPCVGWFSGPGMLFFISLVVSPLIPAVITLENNDIFSSIRRAWDLARSRFWWLVGCALVLALFGWLITSGPIFLMNWILQYALSLIPGSVEFQLVITSIIQNLITIFTSLLYVPLKLTIMTVVYFDLRTRSEGLDLALQMPGSTDPENQVISLPEISVKTETPLITGIDIGRFALLSLAGIAFYGLFFLVIFGIFGLASAAL
jgi:hypothetical protein